MTPHRVLVDLGPHGIHRGELWGSLPDGMLRVFVYGSGVWQVDPRAVTPIPDVPTLFAEV